MTKLSDEPISPKVMPRQYRYDRDLGEIPKLDDKVIIGHGYNLGHELYARPGKIGGFFGVHDTIALVKLKKKLDSGESIIAVPVVCLKLRKGN